MRLLIVDDHALFREGLHNLLFARGVEVVGTARDGLDALEKVRELEPDIILMDIRMPRCDGLTATRLIKAEYPDSRIVILTTSDDENDLLEALRAGASGYLLKSLEADTLISHLTGVMQGEAVLSGVHASAVLQGLARQVGRQSAPPCGPDDELNGDGLTCRQRQILQLVALGLPYKEVASRLSLSERTIKYHMGEIGRLLHFRTREQVVAYALRAGLVRGPGDRPEG